MAYVIICLISVVVSALTLFSGFGLGTLLMPAFAFFFPIPVAIAATAIVHLANNLFKALLVGRGAKWDVVVRFALPGAAAAILGAALLNAFANLPNLYTYALGGQIHNITLLKVIIAAIIIFLAIFDLVPAWSGFAFDPRYLPFGGMLSGFLGGLSGQQGLLRAAFLIKLGLSKEAFIGTSVMTAVIVDIARLIVYGISFYSSRFQLIQGEMLGLVVAGSLAAFAGAWIGARFMHKVTLRGVQVLVSVMLIAIGLALGIGLI